MDNPGKACLAAAELTGAFSSLKSTTIPAKFQLRRFIFSHEPKKSSFLKNCFLMLFTKLDPGHLIARW